MNSSEQATTNKWSALGVGWRKFQAIPTVVLWIVPNAVCHDFGRHFDSRGSIIVLLLLLIGWCLGSWDRAIVWNLPLLILHLLEIMIEDKYVGPRRCYASLCFCLSLREFCLALIRAGFVAFPIVGPTAESSTWRVSKSTATCLELQDAHTIRDPVATDLAMANYRRTVPKSWPGLKN
jgi:hypothetical protein